MAAANRRILPGFVPSLSYALIYLTMLVLIPLAACFIKAASLPLDRFWAAVWNPRALAAYQLTFGASFAAAFINVFLGLLIAWVLVRYEFPLKKLFDSLIDLPFALPTAVAGLIYASLYNKNGWLGQFLVPLGIHGAYSQFAVVLILTFIGLPFVVRTVQPVLEEFDREQEEAAACLGASRLTCFFRIILPALIPSILTGFALVFARCLGEYGSVVFISGNKPMDTEIAPVLIVSRLESFQYAEATAIAVVLLLVSFTMLIVINFLQRWSRRHEA